MKHLLVVFLTLAFVFVPSTTQAAPFDTRYITWTQPNGTTTFTARLWGDEFQWWFETQSGHRIVQSTDNWYYYATLNSDGEYTPTTSRVGIDSPPSGSWKLERSAARIASINQQIAEFQEQLKRNDEWFAQKQAAAKASGQPVVLRLAVILVEFQDVRHYQSPPPPIGNREHGYLKADFDSMLFSQNYWYEPNDTNNSPHPEKELVFGSFRDYWYQMSRGQLVIQGTIINPAEANGVPRWIYIDRPRSFFHYPNWPSRSALFDTSYRRAVDSFSLNPSVWTVNPDTNHFDRYIIIFAGHAAPGGTYLSHAWWYQYHQLPERWGEEHYAQTHIAFGHSGVHAHEFGHVLGLDRDDLHSPPGNYCLMFFGAYNGPQRKGECPATLSPYYRARQGWVTSTVLERDTTGLVIRYNYQNPILYRVNPQGAALDEHYLFEVRLREGFDRYVPTPPELFPQQTGILLVWRHNVVHPFAFPPRVYKQVRVKYADNEPNPTTYLTDFFPNNAVVNRQSLNDLTTPMASLGVEEWASFGGERPAHFALNGIRRLPDSSTIIDTIGVNRAMVANSLAGGWNLVSVPVGLNNYATPAVFPSAISTAFGYVPGSGYVQVDTLTKGAGYFIKFGPTHTIVHSGLLVDSLRIGVTQGWNVIGSISDAVPTSRVCSDPPDIVITPFYRYAGEKGYVLSDTVKPGAGYWVRTNQNGSLTLRRSLSPCTSPIAIDVAEMDRFTITDSRGQEQELYVANVDRDPSLEQIDLSMPPPFPEAEFDARFGTGEFAKTVSPDSGVIELVITVEGDVSKLVELGS